MTSNASTRDVVADFMGRPVAPVSLEPPYPMTCGDYATEADSAAAFDDIATRLGFFIDREVSAPAVTHVGQPENATVRIDRILRPSMWLTGLGWDIGAIGVELKKSNMKIGRPIAQAFDYIWARWDADVRYIFLWPVATFGGGPLASITAQHRIGCAAPIYTDGKLDGISFMSGGHTVARVTTARLNMGRPVHASKVGSR